MERTNAFTQIAFNPNVVLPLEFVFTSTGRRLPKLSPPNGVKYHWAPKGSYHLESLLESIKKLPNRFNMFSHENFAISILDDYHCTKNEVFH